MVTAKINSENKIQERTTSPQAATCANEKEIQIRN